MRGRLVICEKPRDDGRRETPIYVELQDASDFIGAGMRLYCDLGKHDYRPEYKGGLHCELRDKDERLVESKSFPFGGAIPKSEWIKLPVDATIQLRATPFGIHREKAITVCPHLGQCWVISEDDANAYSLSGSFTVAPPPEEDDGSKEHVWEGTIDLPAVRIVGVPNKRR